MAFNITDRASQASIEHNVADAQKAVSDSLERLSSGSVFTRNDPQPAERALAEGLEFKLRSLSSSKRNINSAISLLQTAEAGLSQVSNIVQRMKEINITAASSTISDRDRGFLFVEYQALHDEVDRIAQTTDFNGIPLLNGANPKTPESLTFRIGDPVHPDGGSGSDTDINAVQFNGLKSVIATADGLGLKSAKGLLDNTSGVSLEDAQDLLAASDSDNFSTTYDQALDTLTQQRATFGGMQARLDRAIEYVDIYQENITAAKSAIADVDYAKESSRLVEAKVRLAAGTAVLAQGNINTHQALTLLGSVG